MVKHEERLHGIDPRLADIVRKAETYLPFSLLVVEGQRTRERQAQLVKAGASRTMNSKHLVGRAVDLAPILDGEVRWDWPLFHKINEAMQKAADYFETPITWGGDWKTFKDGPHFELRSKP